MALSTFTELKTSIANWLARDDLTAEIPDFISLCEAEFNRELRIRTMETPVTVTLNAEQVALPTGFLGVRSFFLNSNGKSKLTYITPYHQFDTRGSSRTGIPQAYSIEGTNFRFSPIPDSDYTAALVYYKAFDSLSASTATNHILTNHPAVYLYGSLYHASNFIRGISPDTVAQWQQLFVTSINQIREMDEKEKHNGSPLIQQSGININNYDNV
tara:strand:- start:152 stop:793 length:642 start_codon:yes stop_codon:yes gene_type:complete